ncbi:MAG: hypothetical protein DRN30_02875 [Thermoplasmata archaeon]|nr:MAG: hypothetical protein DRN30_02875 [Thermoplasmata archaeon]
MRIEEIEIEKLIENPKNPNKMTKKDYNSLKKEIEKRGFIVPIIVSDRGEKYFILDGHHRVKALKELGYKTVKAIVLENLTEEQEHYLSINLNKLRGTFELIDYVSYIDTLLKSYGEKIFDELYIDKKERELIKTIKEVSKIEKVYDLIPDEGTVDLEVEIKSANFQGKVAKLEYNQEQKRYILKIGDKEIEFKDMRITITPDKAKASIKIIRNIEYKL